MRNPSDQLSRGVATSAGATFQYYRYEANNVESPFEGLVFSEVLCR